MALFGSCTADNLNRYQSEKPALVMEDFFNGKMDAHGMLMNRSGDVTRRFVVHMDMSWKNGIGTLSEDFDWSDGEKTKRVWTVKKQGEGQFEGSAADIIGVANGNSAGNAFHWDYLMNVKTGDSSYKIRFDDRMWLISDKVLLNEALMYWYGIRVGKIVISFNKP